MEETPFVALTSEFGKLRHPAALRGGSGCSGCQTAAFSNDHFTRIPNVARALVLILHAVVSLDRADDRDTHPLRGSLQPDPASPAQSSGVGSIPGRRHRKA
jgi:hypothetical protein